MGIRIPRSAELFLFLLLGWLQLPGVRRFSTVDGAHACDSGAAAAALTGQKGLSLQQTIDSWTYSLGMRTGLTCTPLLFTTTSRRKMCAMTPTCSSDLQTVAHTLHCHVHWLQVTTPHGCGTRSPHTGVAQMTTRSRLCSAAALRVPGEHHGPGAGLSTFNVDGLTTAPQSQGRLAAQQTAMSGGLKGRKMLISWRPSLSKAMTSNLIA